MPDRGNWEAKYRLCWVEKRHPYFLRHTDSSHFDFFLFTILLSNASHCCITLHKRILSEE
jgi:hypothetical protein